MTAVLKISDVRIDCETQSRVAMNNEVITEYAQAIQDGAEFPPITIFFDGSSWWLADGYHRFFAHKQADKEFIKAIVTQGTKRDAILYSVGANASHGLRRSDADKRRAIMRLLEDPEWSSWSNREIARRCAVHQTTVARVKADIDAFYKGEQEREGVKFKPGRAVVFNSASLLKISPSVYVDRCETAETRTVKRNGKTYQQNTANIGKKKEPVVKNPQPEEQHQSEAPAVDEEKEKLKELLAQAQELNSELAMDLEAAEINTSENKESETLVLIKQRDVERSQKEQYMNKCNELIKQNRLLTNALNRKEKEIEKLKAFIAENRIGEIDAAL